MHRSLSCALIAASLTSMLVAPAYALRLNTYVANSGTNVGACSLGAPCKDFTYAISQTATSGVVTALDSAGYSPFTINKGVTITAPAGVTPYILAGAGGTAITINATQNDAVILRGLTLAGVNSGNTGIFATAAGKIEIIDSVIRDFSVYGIFVEAQNTNILFHVSNTKVMNNAQVGIVVQAFAGLSVSANFDHLTVIDNNSAGISVGPSVNATIVNSNISNNGIGASGGCNLTVGGVDSVHTSFAVLQNLTLGPIGFPGSCSISQLGFSGVNASHVLGLIWRQKDTTDSAVTDGTNTTFNLPPNTGTVAPN